LRALEIAVAAENSYLQSKPCGVGQAHALSASSDGRNP
jgi:hypothetical protein